MYTPRTQTHFKFYFMAQGKVPILSNALPTDLKTKNIIIKYSSIVIHFCYLEERKAYIGIPAFDYYCMIDGIFYVKIETNYMNIGLENDRIIYGLLSPYLISYVGMEIKSNRICSVVNKYSSNSAIW
jgi:hypothetical protein